MSIYKNQPPPNATIYKIAPDSTPTSIYKIAPENANSTTNIYKHGSVNAMVSKPASESYTFEVFEFDFKLWFSLEKKKFDIFFFILFFEQESRWHKIWIKFLEGNEGTEDFRYDWKAQGQWCMWKEKQTRMNEKQTRINWTF